MSGFKPELGVFTPSNSGFKPELACPLARKATRSLFMPFLLSVSRCLGPFAVWLTGASTWREPPL
jgi:hypothetical protein